jgi:D-alanyl-D-alanine carboxypeptidase (penicillin-binding protein 5/6)
MRKFLILILILLILIPSELFADTVSVNCPNAILIDADTGRILYEKNIESKVYPASTTKILTAILVLEKCNLDDEVTASYNAVMSVPVGASIANIQSGEVLTVKELLQALLVCSGNDAANVLAEHVGGSIENFVTMMNTRAIELGAKNTHFANANGLHDDNHYTTAYDMMLFAKYAMSNFPEFREIVSTIRFRLPITNKYDKDDRFFLNSNQLIVPNNAPGSKNYYYEYTTGIKTGFTTQAQNTLVASASKDGVNLIALLFGGKQSDAGVSYRYTDAKALFEYGFNTLVKNELTTKDQVIDTIEVKGAKKGNNSLDVVAADDIEVVMDRDDLLEDLTPVIVLDEYIAAPVNKGDVIGTITYTVYEKDYTTNLLAGKTIEKHTNIILAFFSFIWKLLLVVIALAVLLFCVRVYNKTMANRRRMRKRHVFNKYR